MMFYGFDPLWLLLAVPGMLLGIWAQVKLSHAYGKYSQVAVDSGMTGAEAAREILDRAGLHNVPVEEIPGHLSDHYDRYETGAVSLLGKFSRPIRRRCRRGGA